MALPSRRAATLMLETTTTKAGGAKTHSRNRRAWKKASNRRDRIEAEARIVEGLVEMVEERIEMLERCVQECNVKLGNTGAEA